MRVLLFLKSFVLIHFLVVLLQVNVWADRVEPSSIGSCAIVPLLFYLERHIRVTSILSCLIFWQKLFICVLWKLLSSSRSTWCYCIMYGHWHLESIFISYLLIRNIFVTSRNGFVFGAKVNQRRVLALILHECILLWRSISHINVTRLVASLLVWIPQEFRIFWASWHFLKLTAGYLPQDDRARVRYTHFLPKLIQIQVFNPRVVNKGPRFIGWHRITVFEWVRTTFELRWL